MKRPAFNAPYRMMLILGVISVLSTLTTIRYMSLVGQWSLRDIWIFWMPVLFFVEAAVYWSVRRRIIRSGNVWAHIFLLLAGIVIPYIIRIIANEYYSLPTIERMYSGWRLLVNGGIILSWLMILLAHVFFVVVLRRDLTDTGEREGQVDERNLLDDVIDDPTI